MDEKTPSQKWLEKLDDEELQELVDVLTDSQGNGTLRPFMDTIDEVHCEEYDISLSQIEFPLMYARASNAANIILWTFLTRNTSADAHLPDTYSIFSVPEGAGIEKTEEVNHLLQALKAHVHGDYTDMADNLYPMLSDEPCPRCIRAYLNGLIRKRAIQRLPEGAMAPRDYDGHRQCWDCQAADTLSRLNVGDPDRHSRVATGADRCAQYLLPGAPIGLAYHNIIKKNGPDDWENQKEWMDQNDHIVWDIRLEHTPYMYHEEGTCSQEMAEELEDLGLVTIVSVEDDVYTVNRTLLAKQLVMDPEEFDMNKE